MNETSKIVAYLYKGMWYPAKEVEIKRGSDNNAFVNAHPYTIDELRRRKKFDGKVPEWIDLDDSGDDLTL